MCIRDSARIARVSRGRSRRRTRGPDAHRLGDRTDVDDGLRGVHARLDVEAQVRLRLPRAGPRCRDVLPVRHLRACPARLADHPVARPPPVKTRHRAISRHGNGAPEQTRRKTLVPSLRRGARGRAPRRATRNPGASRTSVAALESLSFRPRGARASRAAAGPLHALHPTWLRHRARTRRPTSRTVGRSRGERRSRRRSTAEIRPVDRFDANRFLDFFEVSRDTFSRATTTRASLLTTNRNVTHRVFRASRVAGG